MSNWLKLLMFVATATLGPADETAQDWPEFRGPTGQGVAKAEHLPLHWSPTKNIAWKQKIPGNGWSSPLVSAGRIYLTTAVPEANGSGNGQSLQALGLDARTGAILWKREVVHQDGATAVSIHGKNSHASPTPLVRNGRFYVHFGYQGTACLDLNGNILWRNTDNKYRP